MNELFRDKFWRLNNLYWIKNKNGKTIKFRMTKEQEHYYSGMYSRNLILKSRQLGFTTLECLIQLDSAIFEGAACGLIAHNLDDANKIFREKVKFAYDKLPELIKQANPAKNDRAGELVFNNGGYIFVGTSARGGTLKRLHVSEFGKICAKYPHKAKEIVTGAFEAVSMNGVITLESTAEGRQGYFYEYAKDAENNHLSNKELSKLDFKFFFFPWWVNDEYSLDDNSDVCDRLQAYFTGLEAKNNIKLNKGQMLWYQAKEKTLQADMKREYPSIPEEAFEQSIEGAYYAEQFRKIRIDGRICKVPDNNHLLVSTFWDIGVGDSTAIWFMRQVGDQYHLIDYYENSGEGLRHYLKVLKNKGYQYNEHYAPHDIENREFGSDAKSRLELAREGYEIDGVRYSIRFKVVPRQSVDNGIEAAREILASCVFDEKCSDGIKCLESYRKDWDDKNGVWKDKPLHDWTSHGADAFRYFAVSKMKKERIAITRDLRL